MQGSGYIPPEHLPGGYTWRDSVEARLGGLTRAADGLERTSTEFREDLRTTASKIDNLAQNLSAQLSREIAALRGDIAEAQAGKGGPRLDWKLAFVAGAILAGVLVGAGWEVGARGEHNKPGGNGALGAAIEMVNP